MSIQEYVDALHVRLLDNDDALANVNAPSKVKSSSMNVFAYSEESVFVSVCEDGIEFTFGFDAIDEDGNLTEAGALMLENLTI